MQCQISNIICFTVDGNWSEWSDWDACPVTCGGGVQNRSRTCTNPPPAFGGMPCPGESDETRSCNEDPCPGKLNKYRKICVVTYLKQGVIYFESFHLATTYC